MPGRSKPSLARTDLVYVASRSSDSGSGTVDSVPFIIEPTYWSGLRGVVDVGSGYPGPSFGPAPSPLALATNSLSGVATTPVGYHAVGTVPVTLPDATSTTATALLPEALT